MFFVPVPSQEQHFQCRCLLCVQWIEVDVNPHCFNFLFITLQVTHISIYTNILYTHTSLKGTSVRYSKPIYNESPGICTISSLTKIRNIKLD